VIALILLLWGVTVPAAALGDPANLCFFSLNSTREYELTRRFVERANPLLERSVRVVEFHDPAREPDPEASFEALVASGTVCEGLVISGHHTGSFSGHRAEGVLNIDLLERLSCDPDYEPFFRQVNALWLQGCRTLGIGPLGPGAGGDRELQADYHMQRVGAELVQEGLEQSFADLSFEFSATLDEDNPLGSRYLRVFPNATVFGWTRSSPGRNAGSDRSLLYHLAHMVHLSQGTPLFDPVTARSPEVTRQMALALERVLSEGIPHSPLARDAWLSHGRVRQQGLGYHNPDLNAYAPLFHSNQARLVAARQLGCEVRNSPDPAALHDTLARILADPEYVAYNLDAVREALRRYRQRQPEAYDALRNQLAASQPLMQLLYDKLKSARTGLLMKIEYYSFYKELTGSALPRVEAAILEQVRYFLLADDLAGSEYDIRDFRESLLLSLASHQLAGPDFYRELIHRPDAQAATLYTLAWSFLKQSPPGADRLVAEIVSQPRAGRGALRASALWMLKNGAAGDPETLATVVAHPDVDPATLATVAAVLAEFDVPDSELLVARIVTHPGTDAAGIRQASLAIRRHDLAVDPALLQVILSHPELDQWGLQNVARVIGGQPHLGSAELLDTIIHHGQVDADGLTSVAIALGRHRFDREAELLDSIRNHPRADERTMRYLERVPVGRNGEE
jgi:hypothetical protein